MEVSVYMSSEAMRLNKSVFKQVVNCPDAFDVSAFVSCMKAIFGKSVIVNVLYI